MILKYYNIRLCLEKILANESTVKLVKAHGALS